MGLTEVSWVERRCQGESRRYPVDGADLGEVHAILTPGTGAKRRFLGPSQPYLTDSYILLTRLTSERSMLS